jgi:hypothetical protein
MDRHMHGAVSAVLPDRSYRLFFFAALSGCFEAGRPIFAGGMPPTNLGPRDLQRGEAHLEHADGKDFTWTSRLLWISRLDMSALPKWRPAVARRLTRHLRAALQGTATFSIS